MQNIDRDLKEESVVNSHFILYNEDMRDSKLVGEYIIVTEAPKLDSMPAATIQFGLKRLKAKTTFVFCDLPLNLETAIQYSWAEIRRRYFLIPYIINRYTYPGDTVVDPFMGYGYIGEVSLALGRRFIGIESNSNIFKIGKENLERCLTF